MAFFKGMYQAQKDVLDEMQVTFLFLEYVYYTIFGSGKHSMD